MVDTQSTASQGGLLGYQRTYVISHDEVGEDSRIRRQYFAGPLMQVTPEWKAAVGAALKLRGMTKTALADLIGCDKSAITILLRPSTTVSRLVAAVSAALDVPLPLIGAGLDASDIIEMVGKLAPDDKARVIDFVSRLSKPK